MSHTKIKSLLTIGLLLSVSSAFFTSCATSNSSGKTTLEMWAGGQWTGHDAENLQEFIDDFNEDPTQTIKINLSLKTNFETAFGTAISVGRQPDLLIWDRFNTPLYAEEDFLLPIEDMMAEDGISSSIFQAQAYNELNYNNHQYGLPLDLDIWGIYVNNDMINDYNAKNTEQVVIPTTWDELYDTAEKLTVRDNNSIKIAGYSTQDLHEHFFKYLVSTGTDLMGNDGYPNYDTQEVKDVLDYFKKLYNANLSTSATNSKESFRNERLAMINQPVYYSSYLKEYAPDLDYTFIPQPKYKIDAGVNGGMIGGYGIALPKALERYQTDSYKEKQALAWDFMKYWLTDTNVQLKWSKISNTLPALLSTYSDEWIQNNQVLKSASEYANNYKIRPQVAGYYYLQVNVYNTYIKDYVTTNQYTLDRIIAKLDEQSRSVIDIYK